VGYGLLRYANVARLRALYRQTPVWLYPILTAFTYNEYVGSLEYVVYF